MKKFGSVYNETFFYMFFKSITVPCLRLVSARCVFSIIKNFFFLQYRCALLKRVPVSKADHPLDEKIIFNPSWVSIYLDFVNFWVRMLSFFLRNFKRRAYIPVMNFIESMDRLYAFASIVYRKNLSTTKRPFYIKKPKFFLIHLTDPHLMCIPSLHVMVVIRTYTLFKEAIKSLGEELRYAPQLEELRRGAIAITEAVLYIKQHSVNCVSAAMYAIACFEPRLFPLVEAERFVSGLFCGTQEENTVSKEDSLMIREHILSLYRSFIAQKEKSNDWTEPLLGFLRL